jgi:hypothetical protein
MMCLGTSILLLSLGGACGDNAATVDGGGGGDGGSGSGADAPVGPPPEVMATTPAAGASGVATNASVKVTFNEAMAPATLDGGFTLTAPGGGAVAGVMIAADASAEFWPTARLTPGGVYTATVTTAATSAGGVHLAASHPWTFTVGASAAPGLPVNLRSAGGFVILAKSAISTVPASVIVGDVAVSPAAASYLTGFSLTADPTSTFASSVQVTGKLYAASYAAPTPAKLTVAIGDLGLAYAEAAARTPDVIELGAGDIGGKTLTPGVYKWGTGLLIPTDVTLSGSATDVWVLQVAQTLKLANGVKVTLSGGALAKNVFWQVASGVDVGTTAHLEGVVLTHTAIALHTGASINGRLYAQTAVSLETATVTQPAP